MPSPEDGQEGELRARGETREIVFGHTDDSGGRRPRPSAPRHGGGRPGSVTGRGTSFGRVLRGAALFCCYFSVIRARKLRRVLVLVGGTTVEKILKYQSGARDVKSPASPTSVVVGEIGMAQARSPAVALVVIRCVADAQE